jgi:uncharacterized protein YecT (DUF1311 family)
MAPRHLVLATLLFALPALGEDRIAPEHTQAGMNETAARRLGAAETAMKQSLDALVKRAGARAVPIAKLREAQTAWERYRDAQLGVRWPSPDAASYGSVFPMCFASAKAELTEARLRELRSMLDRHEGDACAPPWPE